MDKFTIKQSSNIKERYVIGVRTPKHICVDASRGAHGALDECIDENAGVGGWVLVKGKGRAERGHLAQVPALSHCVHPDPVELGGHTGAKHWQHLGVLAALKNDAIFEERSI